jgi:hypothetical protein
VGLNINLLEAGSNLVTYGLLIKTFDKFIYNRPAPAHLSAEEKLVNRQVKSIGRVVFACIYAPFLVWGFHMIRRKSSLFDIKVEIDNKENSSLFLILLNKLKSKRAKIFIILILITLLLFFY